MLSKFLVDKTYRYYLLSISIYFQERKSPTTDFYYQIHIILKQLLLNHRFPTDNRRLELWLKNIEKPSWRPKKYDYICSKHFSEDCFIRHNSCTTLKKCSIPTILCSSAGKYKISYYLALVPLMLTVAIIFSYKYLMYRNEFKLYTYWNRHYGGN